jgi:hypothetical protein
MTCVERNLHTLAEERSIELHRAVGERLLAQPALLDRARARVQGWIETGSTHPFYAQAWAEVLRRPVGEIVSMLTDPGERARALRQASPFAGFIDNETRLRIHRDVLDRWRSR